MQNDYPLESLKNKNKRIIWTPYPTIIAWTCEIDINLTHSERRRKKLYYKHLNQPLNTSYVNEYK